ncbi:MAG: hypothetical protein M3Y49_00650 [Actinomycetota bacterium]|nr:hypothetical protein [Actinomycetota bacterium]
MRSLAVRYAMLAAVVVSLAGCGTQAAPTHPGTSTRPTTSITSPSTSPTSTTRTSIPPTSSPKPHAAAAALLAQAPIPPGAASVAHLPGTVFAQPAMRAACTPQQDATAYYTTTMTGPAAEHYLMKHPGPHLKENGYGDSTHAGTITSWTVTMEPRGQIDDVRRTVAHQSVTYAIAPLTHGTGIRVDAETIPATASCMEAGGGAAAGPAH